MAPSKDPTTIPWSLQGYPELRYCKVLSFDKKAFEDGWNKPDMVYTHDAVPLVDWITNQSGNYGVCCGYGDLLVLDVDELERFKELGILDLLPKTFVVRSRSGGFHFYYFCHDWKAKKIFYDLVLNGKPGKDGKIKALHLGELQWLGVHVVGPNSCFRNEEDPENVVLQYWREENQLPIATVTEEELLNILAGKVKFNMKKNEPVVATPEITPVAPTAILPSPDEKHTVVDAIKALKSVCRGKDIKDNVGFSRWDLDNAEKLINKACSDEKLSSGEESRAYRMLKKYQKQLSTLGIPYDSIGLLERPKRLNDAVKSMIFDLSKQIKIEDHAMPGTPVVRPDENIQGSHPVHGSSRDEEKKGFNFSILPSTAKGKKKNCFHCFRCDSGGGVLEWIAVQASIIECEDAKKGCLIGKEDALEKAIRDLGYDLPERECEMKEGEIGLREHVDLVISRLAYVNEINPQLFIHNGQLVRILANGSIDVLTRDSLPEIIDRAVRFYYMGGKEAIQKRINMYPPPELIGAVLGRGFWPGIPELKAVTLSPIVREDFSICSEPGFDSETGLYYIGPEILLTEEVSKEMAIEAYKELDKALFENFRFKDKASAANTWALLFIALLRLIFALVPGFAFSKPDIASGATTCSTFPSYICQGKEGEVLAKKDDTDAGRGEQQKRLDTALIEGKQFIVMDNEHSVESDYYNTLLTNRTVPIRRLGFSKQVEVANNYLLIFNGKHLSFTDDTARRIILIELEKNNDIVKALDEEIVDVIVRDRALMLCKLLTIVKGWVQAGKPLTMKKPHALLPSFRHAVKVVDSILCFVGNMEAFTNMETARNEANPERESLDTLFIQWGRELKTNQYTSEDLAIELKKIEKYLPTRLKKAVAGGDSEAIGMFLRNHKNKDFADGIVLRNDKIGKKRFWWIEIPQIALSEHMPDLPEPAKLLNTSSSLPEGLCETVL